MEPKIELDREKLPEDNRTKEAKALLVKAGKRLRELNRHYVGSAAVHFYMLGDGLETQLWEMKNQLDIANVPERLAELGAQGLYKDFMRQFGRKVPTKLR